jgi:hypothetical protein
MDGQYKLLKQNEYCKVPLNINSPIGHAKINRAAYSSVKISYFTTKSKKKIY